MYFYREMYGADWYAFECRGVNFMVLNSMLMNFPESCQGEADVQFKWLETKLRKTTHANKQGTVIFMHHLFFDNTIDEDDGYFSIKKAYRRKYLDLFAANNVRAVFSGHRHTTIPERNYKGVRLINTNAICNSFDNKPGLRNNFTGTFPPHPTGKSFPSDKELPHSVPRETKAASWPRRIFFVATYSGFFAASPASSEPCPDNRGR